MRPKTKPAMTDKSVISWPGGKHLARSIMMSFIPSGERRIASPFLGGASVELALAARGATVYGYDVDTALINFWQQSQRHPDALARELDPFGRRYIRRELWQLLAEQYEIERSPLRRAAIFWLRNRWSYGGGSLLGRQSYIGNISTFPIGSIAKKITQ